jgi:hypothetical protein
MSVVSRRWAIAPLAVAAVAVAVYFATARGETPAASACGPPIQRGVLPEWARTGFSDPRPKMPHVLGRSERIAAILFGEPLHASPDPERANKILWVSRDPVSGASDLRIHAEGPGQAVDRVVPGGPGPSIVDLPRAGCWRLTLRWSGRTDVLELAFR